MTELALVADSAHDTQRLAGLIAQAARGGDRILLCGPLGAGKTTFVRGFVEGLEHPDPREVASPTFALHHRYEGGRLPVDHLDLYRIEDPAALSVQGVLDPFQDAEAVSLVEWAERLAEEPSGTALRVTFALEADPDRRSLTLTFTSAGEHLLEHWRASRGGSK